MLTYTLLRCNLNSTFFPFYFGKSQYKVSPNGINKENSRHRTTIITQTSKMLMDFANTTTILTQMPL